MTDDPARARHLKFFREHVLPKIRESAFVMAISPPDKHGDIDVEQALEIGACLLLDKPLLVAVKPGRHVPEHLRRAADMVVEVDVGTARGQETITEAVRQMQALASGPPRDSGFIVLCDWCGDFDPRN